MRPDKRKFKLAQVTINATYDKSGDECYVVTELWKPREFGDFSEDWEYKYKAQTFERANEIAKTRIEKYGK
jgi:hypothetical protein